MKYKYGDIIYCKNYLILDNEPFPMQILSYDEKKEKYLCVFASEYSPGDIGTCIYLIAESNLEYFEKVDEAYSKEIKRIFNPLFPKNMDIRYFDIDEITDKGEVVVYRKTPLHRKEFYIPTR